MSSSHLFVWNAEHGNHLDIQFNVKLWAQTCNWRATGKRIREHFMPEKSMGNRLGIYGETLLRNDNNTDNRYLPLSLTQYPGPLRRRYCIDAFIFSNPFHIHSFPGLSNLFYKGLVEYFPKPINPKNLLPTFEPGIRL